MTESEARDWLAAHVSRETGAGLEAFVAMLLDEMPRQNLIAESTTGQVWARHVVDSAQLVALAPSAAASWIDLGAGAGFPGLVVALLRPDIRVTLVESRRKRIDFLERASVKLGIDRQMTVAGARLETLDAAPHDVISARAFAPLGRLLSLAHRFAHPESCWLLPKGRSAASELEAVADSWQGDFRIVPSLTDPDAAIITARQVQPRARGQRRR